MRRWVAVVLAVLGPLAFAAGASAHPLGNFTVNRASEIVVSPGSVEVRYALDMAEIPTFQTLPSIDCDADGEASGEELQAWADGQAAAIAERVRLGVDDARVALAVTSASAALLPGQADLDTIRLDAVFAGRIPASGTIRYEDPTDDDRLGWREVTARGEEGIALSHASVPAVSPSDLLRDYPEDPLSRAPDVREMRATFAPGASGPASDPGTGGATARPGTEPGGFVSLLGNRGIGLMAAGILVAMLFGAWHALLPGHGKTLMAAAMVGSSARARHVAVIAAAVALMHTTSVLALGAAVLALQRSFRPEAVYPWLGILSGLAALGVGVHLLRQRWRAWRHGHGHDPRRDHGHAHDHTGVRLTREDGRLATGGIAALALAGGILPAPSALLAMLASIQVHRVAYGIGLVLAFSVGLTAALLAVGIGAVRVRDAFARRTTARWALAVPLVSACAIVAAGTFVAARGVASM